MKVRVVLRTISQYYKEPSERPTEKYFIFEGEKGLAVAIDSRGKVVVHENFADLKLPSWELTTLGEAEISSMSWEQIMHYRVVVFGLELLKNELETLFNSQAECMK